MATKRSKYKRILLKLSGETFQAPKKSQAIDTEIVAKIARRIKRAREKHSEIAIVVGGGNIFRGRSRDSKLIDRTTADSMGMLATVINALSLQNALENIGVSTRVQTAIEMKQVAEPFIRRRAIRHLEKGRIVLFSAGTGNPYFTTDSAAALRANEINADVILKATNVEGIYDKDPNKWTDAKLYKRISFQQALEQRLEIMDSAAFSLCMENNMPIIVFNFFKNKNIERIMDGENIGTLVTNMENS
jgi:uridylate kinase